MLNEPNSSAEAVNEAVAGRMGSAQNKESRRRKRARRKKELSEASMNGKKEELAPSVQKLFEMFKLQDAHNEPASDSTIAPLVKGEEPKPIVSEAVTHPTGKSSTPSESKELNKRTSIAERLKSSSKASGSSDKPQLSLAENEDMQASQAKDSASVEVQKSEQDESKILHLDNELCPTDKPNVHTSSTQSNKKPLKGEAKKKTIPYHEAYTKKVGKPFINRLEKESILLLKSTTKEQECGDSHFVCKACNSYFQTEEEMENHRKDPDHLRQRQMLRGTAMLKYIPKPTQAHIDSLSDFLERTYEDIGLPENDYKARINAVAELEAFLNENSYLTDIKLKVCGSVLSRTALKSSDTNVRIVAPSKSNLGKVLEIISDTLPQNDKCSDFKAEFTSKMPSVSFNYQSTSGRFKLSFTDFNNQMTHFTISKYSNCDGKLRKLIVLFKHLCQVLHIIDYGHGSMASFCYVIMAIHFCQFRRFVPLFVFDRTDATDLEHVKITETKKPTVPVIDEPLGKLWLEILRYFCLEFNTERHYVGICSHLGCNHEKYEKGWTTKKLSIEDPGNPVRNLSRVVSHQKVYDFIEDQLAQSYLYFSVPQLAHGPAYLFMDPQTLAPQVVASKPVPETLKDEVPVRVLHSNTMISSTQVSNQIGMKEKHIEIIPLSDESLNDCGTNGSTNGSFSNTNNTAVAEDEDRLEGESFKHETGEPEVVRENKKKSADEYCQEFVDRLLPSEYLFTLKPPKFPAAAAKLPLFCAQCLKAGHVSSDCPEENLPTCLPLPPPSPKHLQNLNKLLSDIKDQNCVTEDNLALRRELTFELSSCIKKIYPTAKLEMFGSSSNGFGMVDSDLDLCMTFTDRESIKEDEMQMVIKKLGKCLYSIHHLRNITTIAAAKVPIVKFYSNDYDREGDISLYNTLAKRNTALLHRYSIIDERVKILGYTVKEFAKKCDIGDASRGSLSSYAYIIMMLFYLQRTSPPVIPVLQQLDDGSKRKVMVDEWDTWFFEGDNRALAKHWSDFGKNKETAGELWLGFLDFFAQKFNWKTTVVCIRQLQDLSKNAKLWNSSTPVLSIEDPFKLTHDLAGALTKKMSDYILSAIIRARARFTVTKEELPNTHRSFYHYFFDTKILTDGHSIPHDRGCRICAKIGHFAKDCPTKSAQKERKKNNVTKKELKDETTSKTVTSVKSRAGSSNPSNSKQMDSRGSKVDSPNRPVSHNPGTPSDGLKNIQASAYTGPYQQNIPYMSDAYVAIQQQLLQQQLLQQQLLQQQFASLRMPINAFLPGQATPVNFSHHFPNTHVNHLPQPVTQITPMTPPQKQVVAGNSPSQASNNKRKNHSKAKK